MKVLVGLTYYPPYISGVTLYGKRLADAFSKLGHEVTVLTMQHDVSLPFHERQNGTEIFRARPLFRLSKGIISPEFWYLALRLIPKVECVHIHLPQFDSIVLALIAKIFRKKVIITYHCDIKSPGGFINGLACWLVRGLGRISSSFADKVVSYTSDYATHTKDLVAIQSKVEIVPPPVEIRLANQNFVEQFRERHLISRVFPTIGMATRLASEKGVEVLIDAMPTIIKHFPQANVLFAGQSEGVLGEQQYSELIQEKLKMSKLNRVWKEVGILTQEEMSAFYQSIDVLVVPSTNATESFGLVQIEAFLHGTPCVASDLPGVRQPVLISQMGYLVEPNDSIELADAILRIFKNSPSFKTPDLSQFSSHSVATRYTEIIQQIQARPL